MKQDTGPKRPKSSAAVGKYRTNHQPSFVDETLFGNGPVEPSFEAPWGEPDKLGTVEYLLLHDSQGTYSSYIFSYICVK